MVLRWERFYNITQKILYYEKEMALRHHKFCGFLSLFFLVFGFCAALTDCQTRRLLHYCIYMLIALAFVSQLLIRKVSASFLFRKVIPHHIILITLEGLAVSCTIYFRCLKFNNRVFASFFHTGYFYLENSTSG